MRYLGIDFSGAKDAGKKIWIAEGREQGHGIEVVALHPARDLPDSGPDGASALVALRRHIASLGNSIVAIDAPNSLPASLTQAPWEAWLAAFAATHRTADDFRARCRQATQGREVKRVCDIEAKTPFAAWNLWLYKQTWHVLTDIYAPLVKANAVTVAPFQKLVPGKPRLVEICPASTLQRLNLYKPGYKGRDLQKRQRRSEILTSAARQAGLYVPPSLQVVAADNHGGDALDALLALVAAVRCRRQIEADDPCSEGEVYVWG